MPNALHPTPAGPMPTTPFEERSGTTHLALRDHLAALLENRGYTRADRTTWRNGPVIVQTANSPHGLVIHRFVAPDTGWYSDDHDWRTATSDAEVRGAVHELIDPLHDMS